MDMRALHLMFTLITVSWAQHFVVSQPSSAEGMEGSSVTLRCSYSSPAKPSVGSYRWVKDPGLEVRNTTREFTGRVIQTSEEGFLSERRADIEILELRHYDSGVYQCVVNIPGLGEIPGNGTELRVVKPPRPPPAAGPKAAQLEDYMVLIWLLVRGILCTFGITTVALATRQYYKTSSPKKAHNRPPHRRENKYKSASRK